MLDISQEMGISSEDIAQRMEFLEFTQTDIDNLCKIHSLIESLHTEDVFSGLFYRHLLAFPELRKFIPDEATLNRLKAIQSQYFRRLTAGKYDTHYVSDRLRVGCAHQQIGLDPKWYIGAYRKYLSFLLSSISDLYGLNNEEFLAIYDALLKVVFFDMELALDTYFHADRQKLLHIANHDALTGLANRNLLDDRIEQALHKARRDGGLIAILFIDLNRFKNINDSLGHQTGDEVILEVSSRIVGSLRDGDTVARLGGDEFVVVLSGVERRNIAPIAEKILYGIGQPITVNAQELFVSASIGIAIHPMDGENQNELLKNSDAAMYRAKQEGHNTFCFYQREMNSLALARLNLETKLRHALEKREFLLHYQPLIDFASGRIVGAEALIRWQTSDCLISPLEFIPLAEETGLIIPIGEWVLETGCQQAVYWNNVGNTSFKVAINLSTRQIWGQDIVGTVSRILAETGCKPEWLELEITESTIMHRPEVAANTLKILANMGITISIDDFGTGYSSLAYLKRFPIHSLKIDRSFIQNITSDPDDASIVRAVIALAHSLDLKVVGEGVEDESQLTFLGDLGCDLVQGYFFSSPLPAELISRMYIHGPERAALHKIRNEIQHHDGGITDGGSIKDIDNCRVRRVTPHLAICMVNDAHCIYALPYGNLCEHPLVDQIANAT